MGYWYFWCFYTGVNFILFVILYFVPTLPFTGLTENPGLSPFARWRPSRGEAAKAGRVYLCVQRGSCEGQRCSHRQHTACPCGGSEYCTQAWLTHLCTVCALIKLYCPKHYSLWAEGAVAQTPFLPLFKALMTISSVILRVNFVISQSIYRPLSWSLTEPNSAPCW